jgi:hypothetical protein
MSGGSVVGSPLESALRDSRGLAPVLGSLLVAVVVVLLRVMAYKDHYPEGGKVRWGAGLLGQPISGLDRI